MFCCTSKLNPLASYAQFGLANSRMSVTVAASRSSIDPIVECAVRGNAEYIVTGDKRHLLPMGSYEGILIVTPSRLLELVSP